MTRCELGPLLRRHANWHVFVMPMPQAFSKALEELPNSMDELNALIEEEQHAADAIHDNPQVIAQYNKRVAEIQQEQKKLDLMIIHLSADLHSKKYFVTNVTQCHREHTQSHFDILTCCSPAPAHRINTRNHLSH